MSKDKEIRFRVSEEELNEIKETAKVNGFENVTDLAREAMHNKLFELNHNDPEWVNSHPGYASNNSIKIKKIQDDVNDLLKKYNILMDKFIELQQKNVMIKDKPIF